MMEDRDFKGVWIPKEVWLDERLNMLEKGILVEIDSLDKGDDGCWASNEHLATFCQCSVTKVATAVTKLVNLGYLRRESFDGRRRKLKSSLSFYKRRTFKDLKPDFKNLKESNTSKETKRTNSSGCDGDDFLNGFDDFWSVYPRKAAKSTAKKAWSKLKPDDDLQRAIIADVKRRVDGDWKGKDVQYIPHPTTYLNQRRWEDEQPEPEEPRQGLWYEGLTDEERQRREDEQAAKDREMLYGKGWLDDCARRLRT